MKIDGIARLYGLETLINSGSVNRGCQFQAGVQIRISWARGPPLKEKQPLRVWADMELLCMASQQSLRELLREWLKLYDAILRVARRIPRILRVVLRRAFSICLNIGVATRLLSLRRSNEVKWGKRNQNLHDILWLTDHDYADCKIHMTRPFGVNSLEIHAKKARDWNTLHLVILVPNPLGCCRLRLPDAWVHGGSL